MTLEELIKEYKALPEICSKIDYGKKNTVKANNEAVERMYKIVNSIREEFGWEGTEEFQKLLDIKENDTSVWAATHLLEKLSPDKKNEKKALKIIRKIIEGNDKVKALGYTYWLKDWQKKK